MVSLEHAVVARLKTHGQTFEILVDCENALRFRCGERVDMQDVLASEKIFTEQSKGAVAAESILQTIFGTTDALHIAQEIIRKGDIQLTAAYRAKLRERKYHAVIETIHRNGIDPRTGLPHPAKRIELAFEQANVHVDEFKHIDAQMEDILKKIQPILPIRFEMRKMQVQLPAKEAEKAYKVVGSYGKKVRDEWKSDGSYVVVVEIPAGLQAEFSDYLNKLTHGNNETRVL